MYFYFIETIHNSVNKFYNFSEVEVGVVVVEVGADWMAQYNFGNRENIFMIGLTSKRQPTVYFTHLYSYIIFLSLSDEIYAAQLK